MKEIKDIIAAYEEIDNSSHKIALATVVHVDGSSYRRTGARMLVRDDGVFFGGISGGCLEGDALKKANHCMARNKIEVVRYDTTQDDEGEIGVGLGCNGIIDVLLCPIHPEDESNPIKVLSSCLGDRFTNCLITVIESQNPNFRAGQMIKYQKGKSVFFDALEKDIHEALASNKSRVRTYEEGLSVFIEILQPAINVLLFGYSYDVYPLLKIGSELGWTMGVVTKANKVTAKMRALANDIYIPEDALPCDNYTAYVLMAHDYKTDKNNLAMALQSEVPYVGMLGPLKRRKQAIEELENEGMVLSSEQMDKLYNPIGLNIGASTPEEIALTILSEIRAHFSGKKGGFLREISGPIHQ